MRERGREGVRTMSVREEGESTYYEGVSEGVRTMRE